MIKQYDLINIFRLCLIELVLYTFCLKIFNLLLKAIVYNIYKYAS